MLAGLQSDDSQVLSTLLSILWPALHKVQSEDPTACRPEDAALTLWDFDSNVSFRCMQLTSRLGGLTLPLALSSGKALCPAREDAFLFSMLPTYMFCGACLCPHGYCNMSVDSILLETMFF